MQIQCAVTSSAELFSWLEGFVNLERNLSAASFRLDRMEKLASLAGHPETCAPVIHVAGSKGKGSVTTMVASILEATGLETALYVSPHILDWKERIGRAHGPFAESIYVAAGNELRAIVAEAGKLPGELEPTFFELMTLLFFLCARKAGVKAIALETGIGGRLDATNIVTPRVSVITEIELEHTDILGTTIVQIAREKAGIIKQGGSVLTGTAKEEALGVFRERTEALGCPFIILGEVADVSGIDVSKKGTRATLSFRGSRYFKAPIEISLALVGEIQAHNAALAALAVRLAFPEVSDLSIGEGLSRTFLPARFQKVSEEPVVILDGAHTASSVTIAAECFERLYGREGILLFGCAIDKDVEAMAVPLASRFSRAIVTSPGSFKKGSPERSLSALRSAGLEAELEAAPVAAVSKAVALARTEGKPLLVTGSFYLASEAERQFH